MAKLNETIRSWCRILGEIIEVAQGHIVVQTKALDSKGNVRLDKMNEPCIDDHPVIIPDKALLAKMKVGKRIGFRGWLKREGNRTMLVMNTSRMEYVQTKLPDGFINQAGLAGLVVFSRLMNDDASKRAQLTIGIGEPNTTGTAIWCVAWQSMAVGWDRRMQGCKTEARIIGRMRSRTIPSGIVMYELVAESGSDLVTEPITTGFESFDEEDHAAMTAAMAFQADLPPEATGLAEDNLSDHTNPDSADDDLDKLPF